jgi:hypothetical protein
LRPVLRQSAVIVAVPAVRVMQVAHHEVIHVIAVRNRFVAASGTVDVRRIVGGAGVRRSAGVGIGGRNLDHVLVEMVAVRGVEVAVVQVIDVVSMPDRGMAAILAVDVGVVVVNGVAHA